MNTQVYSVILNKDMLKEIIIKDTSPHCLLFVFRYMETCMFRRLRHVMHAALSLLLVATTKGANNARYL
jgi:hypothetical protein